MIGRDRIGDRLQQHRLAGARRGDDQSALAFADGRQQIHHAAGVVVLGRLHLQPRLRIERREVVEENLVAGFLGRLEVDRVDFDQREVPLAFLGRADLAADGVAGAQIEAADLRGRNVDVVGTGQVVVFGRAQEAEAVGQAFEHAFGEDQAALFGLHLQDLEDQLLLAQSREALDAQILGDLVELLDAHVLELHQVERVAAVLGLACLRRGGAWDRTGVRPVCGGPARLRLAASAGCTVRLASARRWLRAAARLGGFASAADSGLRLRRGRLSPRQRPASASAGGFGFRGPAFASAASRRLGPVLRLGRFRLGRLPAWSPRPWRAAWCRRWRLVVTDLVLIFEIACQISLTPRPVTAEHSELSRVSFAESLQALVPFFLRLQLVHFRRDHHVRPPVALRASLATRHPSPSSPAARPGRAPPAAMPATEQVALDQLLPLLVYFLGDFCETIPWQIDEAVTPVDLVEIDQLRTARPGTGARQPVGPHQRIQKAGFADVAAAQERNFSFRSPAETAPAWLHLL